MSEVPGNVHHVHIYFNIFAIPCFPSIFKTSSLAIMIVHGGTFMDSMLYYLWHSLAQSPIEICIIYENFDMGLKYYRIDIFDAQSC